MKEYFIIKTLFLYNLLILLSSSSISSSSNSSSSDYSLSDYYYGIQYGSNGNDYLTSISINSNNNYIYITGNSNESLYNLNFGAQDVILSKQFSNNGTFIWNIQYGSKLTETGIAVISKDLNDNDIFLTGYTTGYIFQNYSSNLTYLSYVASDTNSATQNYISYDIKLCFWQRIIVTACPYYWGTSYNYLYFILYNSNGLKVANSIYSSCSSPLSYLHYDDCEIYTLHLGCYKSESCSATVAIIINSYPNNIPENSVDVFVARHNSTNGNLIWGIQYGTYSIDTPNDIDISLKDNAVYIIGTTFGSLYPSNYRTSSLFISKLNGSNGDLLWGYQNGSKYQTYGISILVDNYDNYHENSIYVLGFTTGAMFSQSFGGYDIITFKLSSNKEIIWSIQYGTKDDEYPLDMAQSDNNNNNNNESYLYICGYTSRYYNSDYSFLYKLNSKNGNIIWKKKNSMKYDWSISIFNSSIYISSIYKYQYQLSKYDSEFGENYWNADITNIPSPYFFNPTYSSSLSSSSNIIPTLYNNNLIKPSIIINSNESIRMVGSISGSIYNNSFGKMDYFILSPNICYNGYYSVNYINKCEICPQHYYSSEGSNKCKKCDRGYDSKEGSSSCYKCYGGYYHDDYSECFYKSDKFIYYVLILIFPFSILTCTLIIVSWANIGFALTAILSTSDLLSDILYITTTFFYSSTLFYIAIFLLFPPLFQLIGELIWKVYKEKNTLRMFHIPNCLIHLKNYHIIIWIIIRIFNFLFWCAILLPYLIFTLMFGYYLLQTKLLSIPYYENLWHNIFFINESNILIQSNLDTIPSTITNNNNNNNNNIIEPNNQPKKSVNSHSLNKTVMVEILFEAIPQIIIQTYNNILMKSFGTIALISLIVSILMIFNSLYRILYYHFYHGLPLSKIPLPFQNTKVKTKFPKLNKLLNSNQNQYQFDNNANILNDPLLGLLDRESNNSSLVELSSIIIDENEMKKKINEDEKEQEKENLTPIIIKFKTGIHDITFKQKMIHQNDNKYILEVFLIEKDSPLELMNIIGYIVTSINGINYHDSKIQLSSKYCSENCEVTLSPPIPNIITLKLENKINSFQDIGIVMSMKKTFFSDINLFQIQSIISNSIAELNGLTSEYYLISVNDKYFDYQINNQLFFNVKEDYTLNHLFLQIFHYFKLKSYTIKNEIQLENQSTYILTFKKPKSIEWMDQLSFYQEILNNHLKSINFFIFKVVYDKPMIGFISFFYSDTKLDSFGLLLLYVFGWIIIYIIHQIWIPFWIIFTILKYIFSLPLILFSLRSNIKQFISIFSSTSFYCLLFMFQYYLTILFTCSIAYVKYQLIYLWFTTLIILSFSFIGIISIHISSLNFILTTMILPLSFLQSIYSIPKYISLIPTSYNEIGRQFSICLFILTFIQFIRYIIWKYCYNKQKL